MPTINNLHVVLEILFISPQYVYNILLALYSLIAAIFDILQMPMCQQETNLKVKNLEIHRVFHLIQLHFCIPRTKVHLSHPPY